MCWSTTGKCHIYTKPLLSLFSCLFTQLSALKKFRNQSKTWRHTLRIMKSLPVTAAVKSDPQASILQCWSRKESIALGTLEFYNSNVQQNNLVFLLLTKDWFWLQSGWQLLLSFLPWKGTHVLSYELSLTLINNIIHIISTIF